MQRPPINYIVSINDSLIAEFVSYWVYFNMPCSMLLQHPRSDGLVAVKLVVDSDEAAEFLERVRQKTGCKLFIK